MKGLLTELSIKYDSDKHVNEFTKIYDILLQGFRSNIKSVLELGILKGSSLRMWREYFPNAKIVGVDINTGSLFTEERITTYKYNMSNADEIQLFMNSALIDNTDLIIDDASHCMIDQQLCFGMLFHKLSTNGIYIIEDLHTSLYNQALYGIESDWSNTTLNMVKNYIDTKKIVSKYLSKTVCDELEHVIDSCVLIKTIGISAMFFKKNI
jgi:trans-aconitate methyltransferase